MRMARRIGFYGGLRDKYIFNGAVITPYTWTTDRDPANSNATAAINTSAHPGVIYLEAKNNSAYPYAQATMQYTINVRPYSKICVRVTQYAATENSGNRYRPTIWVSDGNNEYMMERAYAPSTWEYDISSWETFTQIRLRVPDNRNKGSGSTYPAVILEVSKIWLTR